MYGPVQKIIVEETEAALRKMNPGKAVGPDDLAADLWKSKSWYPDAWLKMFFNQLVAEKRQLAGKRDDPDEEEGGQSSRVHKLPYNSFIFA
ncbi:unnamed protein product [Heligmosomoides polygyrus]|uniref:Uncharacterized protein n=1 Tax=Heligmosomoides polygyrus TaxID=6339 RepID=A0A183G4E1_HELPZ|nr:unnamed protein product [Heligmosomoides polygyrus]